MARAVTTQRKTINTIAAWAVGRVLNDIVGFVFKSE